MPQLPRLRHLRVDQQEKVHYVVVVLQHRLVYPLPSFSEPRFVMPCVPLLEELVKKHRL